MIDNIFEFYNLNSNDCGHAAAATLLCFHNYIGEDLSLLAGLEKAFPADELFGLLGCSPDRVKEILSAYSFKDTQIIDTEERFRTHIGLSYPLIVLLTVHTAFWGMSVPCGHWTVAYKYDDDYVYLSNYGKMSWEEFRLAWNSFVPRAVGMNGKAIGLSSFKARAD
jgi:hypothetical protein